MRDLLNDLVTRMTLPETVKSSNRSMSWHAHREAERLADTSLIGELETFVERVGLKEQRMAAYFILCAIGQNTLDVRCVQILVRRASIESEKYVLSALLDDIAKLAKPEELSLAPVFSLLHDKRWPVRRAAIQALKHSVSARVEDELLAILATTTDPYDKCYCHATLGNIGSRLSLPLLADSLTSRKRDVKSSAESAIAAIRTRMQ